MGQIVKKVYRKALKILSFVFNRFRRIDNRLFVFQSEGDFWDNARALYEYMVSKGLNKEFRLVWFVKEP